MERKDEIGRLAVEVNNLIDYIETENLYKAQQRRLLQQKAEQDALTKVLNKERISSIFRRRWTGIAQKIRKWLFFSWISTISKYLMTSTDTM